MMAHKQRSTVSSGDDDVGSGSMSMDVERKLIGG